MLISIETGQEIRAILTIYEIEICESRLTNEEHNRVYDKLYAYSETDEISIEAIQDDHY